MEKKNMTKGDLERMIRTAIVFIPKTKGTQSVHFDDKGVRIEITDDHAIVRTPYHTHVFEKITSIGYSKPYLYLKRFVEIALDVDCIVKDSRGNITRSYKKLFDTLKESGTDNNEYTIAMYVDWYMFNIYQPLYSIGEDSFDSFMTYFSYMSNISTNSILLGEHKDGMTNKEFVKKYLEVMEAMLKDMTEQKIIEPISDKDVVNKAIDEATGEAENNENNGE